jgi:hypothetical protein
MRAALLALLRVLPLAAQDWSPPAGDTSSSSSSGGGGGSGAAAAVRVRVAASDSTSLAAALLQAQAHREAGREVHLQLQGRYFLDAPLNFSKPMAQSGRRLPPLLLHGPAVLDGGHPVINWTRDTARSWLWSAPVPTALRSAADAGTISQLFDGDTRVPPARTPVLHYVRVGAVNASSGMTKSIVVNASAIPQQSLAQLSGVRLFMCASSMRCDLSLCTSSTS